jgi:hypothetical protein
MLVRIRSPLIQMCLALVLSSCAWGAEEGAEEFAVAISSALQEHLGEVSCEAGFRSTFSKNFGVMCGFWYNYSGVQDAVVTWVADKPSFCFYVAKSRLGEVAGTVGNNSEVTCDVFDADGLAIRFVEPSGAAWTTMPQAVALHASIIGALSESGLVKIPSP